MSIRLRNNIKLYGDTGPAILFAHGFGCDQNMWRYIIPAFAGNYRVILFDHVGAGASDLSAFDKNKYAELDGYADDIIEIIHSLELDEVIFVGHSVSAIIGCIAATKQPGLFSRLVLVAPSPCYINDNGYTGGFTRTEIEELLEALDDNHLGWSMQMAPVIMGNSDRQELAEELTESFCHTDPEITRHFARATFLSDQRSILPEIKIPTLILQCSQDIIAPATVGQFMHEQIEKSELVTLKATGHCPNLSAPEETTAAIKQFLA